MGKASNETNRWLIHEKGGTVFRSSFSAVPKPERRSGSGWEETIMFNMLRMDLRRLFQNRSEEAGIYPTNSPMAAFTKVSL